MIGISNKNDKKDHVIFKTLVRIQYAISTCVLECMCHEIQWTE